MGEVGISFSDEMVRAILAGRKTVTRRPIKRDDITKAGVRGIIGGSGPVFGPCPYGEVGDVMVVREAWAVRRLEAPDGSLEYPNILYRSTSSTRLLIHEMVWKYVTAGPMRWRSARTMPLAFARIRKPITSVTAEQSQDITEVEGVKDWNGNPMWVWRIEWEASNA